MNIDRPRPTSYRVQRRVEKANIGKYYRDAKTPYSRSARREISAWQVTEELYAPLYSWAAPLARAPLCLAHLIALSTLSGWTSPASTKHPDAGGASISSESLTDSMCCAQVATTHWLKSWLNPYTAADTKRVGALAISGQAGKVLVGPPVRDEHYYAH